MLREKNGNQLIEGCKLTENQKSMLLFNGMKKESWILAHAFWFKNGKPSTEEGFYYPVMNATSMKMEAAAEKAFFKSHPELNP